MARDQEVAAPARKLPEEVSEQVLEELGVLRRPKHLHEKYEDSWRELLTRAVQRLGRHGDLAALLAPRRRIAAGELATVDLDQAAPAVRLGAPGRSMLAEVLQELNPWKKGPFAFDTPSGRLELDAEWRSDHKWKRVQELGVDFRDQHVLDVGTGNGYFLYRLIGAGARSALGLEPGVLSTCQYLLLQRLFCVEGSALLPVTSSEFIGDCAAYDIVMSMGVLYHRRSPLDHLQELKGFLRPGGRLILETIALPGPPGFSLVPEQRYAQMRNVFFLPSPDTLVSWLRKIGYVNIVCSSLEPTSVREQRSTPWMPHPSLDAFLERVDDAPDSPERRTIEGHPRPQRLLVTALVP